MNIFYDTEFLEDGKTIELISIGIVNEGGKQYYAVNRDMPMERIVHHEWLMKNVMPHLPALDSGDPCIKDKPTIAREVAKFVLDVPDPRLWAWYGAYDHVVLCQLFGRMMDLPQGFPMWTNDLRQEVMLAGDIKLPNQVGKEHDALADAMWVKKSYYWLLSQLSL